MGKVINFSEYKNKKGVEKILNTENESDCEEIRDFIKKRRHENMSIQIDDYIDIISDLLKNIYK